MARYRERRPAICLSWLSFQAEWLTARDDRTGGVPIADLTNYSGKARRLRVPGPTWRPSGNRGEIGLPKLIGRRQNGHREIFRTGVMQAIAEIEAIAD